MAIELDVTDIANFVSGKVLMEAIYQDDEFALVESAEVGWHIEQSTGRKEKGMILLLSNGQGFLVRVVMLAGKQ